MSPVVLYVLIGIFTVVGGALAALSILSRSPPTAANPNLPMICGDSPNCVSSEASDESHLVSALPLDGEATGAMRAMTELITAMPRSTVIRSDDEYLHAEFQTSLFRFIDDVEMRLNSENRTIEVRSRSRVGRKDFGQNRRRIDEIRSLWHSRRNRDSD